MMRNKVKEVIHTFGDGSGSFARRLGCGTSDFARRVGGRTSDLAHRVGPKRGLLGLAVFAAAVGGTIYLVRYLRARHGEEYGEMGGGEEPRTFGRRRGIRAQRRAREGEASVTY